MMADDRALVDAAHARRPQAGLPAADGDRAGRRAARAGPGRPGRPDAGGPRGRPARRSRAAPGSSRYGAAPRSRRPARSCVADDLGPGEVAAWAGRIAGDRAGGQRRHRPRGDRRALAGDPAGDGGGRPALADPGRRAGRRSTPTAAWCCAGSTPATRARFGARGSTGPASRRERDRARAASSRRSRRRPRRCGCSRTPARAAEVTAALEAGAEGIGLLRSELAFLDAPRLADRGRSTRAALRAAAAPARRPHRDRADARLRRRQDAAVPGRARAPRARSAPRGIRLALAAEDGVDAAAAGAAARWRATPCCGSWSRWSPRPAEVDAVRELRPRARDAVVAGRPRPARGGDDRGARGCAERRAPIARLLRLPLDRDERPRPVHARRRPPESRRRRAGGRLPPGRDPADRARGGRRPHARASRSTSAARRPATPRSCRCWSASASTSSASRRPGSPARGA